MSGGPAYAPHAAGYVHPFPAADWTPGRTDMGMDFAPKKDGAPIVSPGRARILKNTAPPNWPGGDHGLLLKLLEGDHANRIIYIYESLTPSVHPGQQVMPGDKIAEGRTGGTGIEIGWADPSGATLSAVHGTTGQKDSGRGTPEGRDMAAWLGGLHEQGGALIPSPGAIAGDVVGAAGHAAGSVASGIVSALFDAIGADGARILLYIGFVLGGTAMALGGISVMMGGSATDPIKFAGKLPKPVPVPV